MKVLIYLIAFFIQISTLLAQTKKPIQWSYSLSKEEVAAGGKTDLVFKAELAEGWYLYSNDLDPDLSGPMATTFEFEPNATYKLAGNVKPIGVREKYDSVWMGNIRYFLKTATFQQPVKIVKDKASVSVKFFYQVCSDIEGKCIPYEEEFTFTGIKMLGEAAPSEPKAPATPLVEPAPKASVLEEPPKDSGTQVVDKNHTDSLTSASEGENSATLSTEKVTTSDTSDSESPAKGDSFFLYILSAIGLGLLALLMPCVFPIIPMTVTYFLKNSKTRKDGLVKSFIYGLSIVVIYTSLAVLPALFIGEKFAIELSSNWVVNLIFFIVFIIFGLSFLGMFEITLPARFVNRVDSLSDKGGLLGIFFMAFTLVLVSFSCTVPFVSQVIVEVTSGNRWKPIVGMLAYSITFAIPFVLFALFPSLLQSLPKSGSWMTVLKVTLGFVELGFAFKFLSALDLSYGLNLLPRDVFIAIWIALSFVLGLYLLGKLVLPHDTEVKRLSVPRVLVAVLSFTFGIYLVPGLFGAPLNFLSAILPPADYHSFNLKEIIRETVADAPGAGTVHINALPEPPMYGHELKLPHGLTGYFDYHQAVRVARQLNKPLFIDFTGKNCGNCRKMENAVWAEPSVLSVLKNDYLVVALYADVRKLDLPEDEIYIGSDGKRITKLYKKNLDIEFSRFGDVAQPFYVLLNPFTEEKLVTTSLGYEPDVEKFVQYLEEGKKNFKLYSDSK
jgi:thiol:disulfide interchange protein